VAVLLALALGAGAVFGQGYTLWQEGGVQLCGTSSSNPVLATTDSAGGAIILWMDTRNGIYAQRIDAAGSPQWTENGVLLCDSIGQALNSDAVDDGKGGAIAVWGPPWRPFAVQRVSVDGVPLWGSDGFELRPRFDSLVEGPALVSDGRGGAIVVWNASPLYSMVDTLVACHVDSSGTKQWETVVRIDTLDDAPPCLCRDGLGGAIIAWDEYDGHSGHWAMRAQRVDSAGAIKWYAAGVPLCTLATVQYSVECVDVGGSRFVVDWRDGGGGSYRCRAQMLDLAGNRVWGPTGVPVTGTSYSSSGGVVLPTGDRRQSIWLWCENRTGTNDFFAQKLDSAGSRRWDSTGVWLGTVDTSGGQLTATVDGRGGAIAAWTMYRSQLNWDIYCQRVDSVGRLLWSDTGLAVCTGDNNVRYPVAVSDGDGGSIIAWKDDRGIYAQRVADGAGVAETMNDECRAMSIAQTVVRGVLFLPEEATSPKLQVASCLLDISGRSVLDLQPGANDVRALAPGVYFVRKAQAQAQAQAVRKIVKLK
jgi:hypothetical protein